MDRVVAKRASRRHLPPLQSLAAFDAAVRHGSFTQAADELCITQSAISQRIRALEDFLQCPLFRRLTRRVELTPQGAQLAPRIAELLDRLQLACDLGGAPAKTTLTLSVVASFASRWMVPRLGEFTHAHPGLDVHLLTNSGFARTLPDEVDAAILWGRPGDWPGLAVCRFMRADLFPVCSPALLEGKRRLGRPAGLRRHVLLRHRRRNYWPSWLALAGVGQLHFVYGPGFDNASLALEAAIHGQGICISNMALAGDQIAAGRLVRPFVPALPSDMMNPVTGREAAWRTLQPVAQPRSILVVGGGPCGMKAAALSAERDHHVWLAEAAPALGRHLRRLAALPGRGRWQDAIDSLAEPLGRLGVETMLGVEATPALVRRLQPEVVVCATGAVFSRSGYSPLRPDRPGIPGADGSTVLDIGSAIDRLLADSGALGRLVVILDEGQDVLTAGLAELLARGGAHVRIVTPHLHFGEAFSRTYELPVVMKRFAALGVQVTPQLSVEAIEGARVRLAASWSGAAEILDDVGAVVLAQARAPALKAFEALRAAHPDVRRIGDALAPRGTEAVIYEGETFGREI